MGDFGKLWQSLGLPASTPAPPLPPVDESELSNSDDALLPSPILGAIDKQKKHEESSPVKVREDAESAALTKKQRQKARKQAEKAQQEQAAKDVQLHSPTKPLNDTPKPVVILKPTKVATKLPSTPVRAQSNVGAKMSPVRPLSPVKVETLQSPIKLPGKSLHRRSKSNALPSPPKRQAQVQPQLPETAVAHHVPVTPMISQSHPLIHFIPSIPYSAPHGQNLIPSTVRPVSIPRSINAGASSLPVPATPSPAPFPLLIQPSYPTFNIRPQVDQIGRAHV